MNVLRPTPPIDPWLTETVRIEDIKTEIDGVQTYTLSPPRTNDRSPDCRFIPGQFNMLYVPGVGESAISMSGDPSQTDRWVHTVRVAGNVTRTLSQLRQGSTLGLRGPFGQGWPIDDLTQGDVIIVAGGLGLAPLRPLIYDVIRRRDRYGYVWLVNGARTPDSLLFKDEYQSWRDAGIDLSLTVDRGSSSWTGHIGVVTVVLERLPLKQPNNTLLVACGPEVMMKYTAETAIRRGLSSDRIWVSLERNMQCAAGLCGHCQLGPEFICKDGPVLRYDRVHQYMFVEQL